MTSPLDRTDQELGDGSTVTINSGDVVFKLDSFGGNPVVTPQDVGLSWLEDGRRKVGAIFNCGAEVFQGKIILTPRCHQGYWKGTFFDEKLGVERYCLENYISEVWPLVSDDGVRFKRYKNVVIKADGTDHRDFTYGIEDLRIIKYGHRYLLIGCGKVKPPFKHANADRIAIYSTDDFVNIAYHGMITSFDSRNAIPFSEPVNAVHYMLLRFHPNIHLAVLEAGMDQLLNPSKHDNDWIKIYEGRTQNLLLEAGQNLHEKEKVGPSTQVIKTRRGWLLIYHAVGEISENICRVYGLTKKIERGYSVCAAVLDPENPRNVVCRTKYPIYIPSEPYELYGNERYPVDVPAVVFPVGAMVRRGKLIIYAGAADKYIILLTCNLDKLVDYLWEHCQSNT